MHKLRIMISIIMLAAISFAQTAELTGLITDPSGAPVPGAGVSVRNIETGVNTDTVTNNQGYYTVTHLNPGNYELTVQKTGFKALTRPGIKLDSASSSRRHGTHGWRNNRQGNCRRRGSYHFDRDCRCRPSN